jgi:hypothetical protein
MIHRAQTCYTNVLENRFSIAHNVHVVALYRLTLFMFIFATGVAVFVLNIGYELISGIRGAILLNQFCLGCDSDLSDRCGRGSAL